LRLWRHRYFFFFPPVCKTVFSGFLLDQGSPKCLNLPLFFLRMCPPNLSPKASSYSSFFFGLPPYLARFSPPLLNLGNTFSVSFRFVFSRFFFFLILVCFPHFSLSSPCPPPPSTGAVFFSDSRVQWSWRLGDVFISPSFSHPLCCFSFFFFSPPPFCCRERFASRFFGKWASVAIFCFLSPFFPIYFFFQSVVMTGLTLFPSPLYNVFYCSFYIF